MLNDSGLSTTSSVRKDDLLTALLSEQQQTAVQQFSQWHSQAATPLQAIYYRDLIPLSQPKTG